VLNLVRGIRLEYAQVHLSDIINLGYGALYFINNLGLVFT